MRAVVAGTHDALIYRGPEEFATAVTEFVHEGVSGGERTLVMVGRDKAERLQSDLGADADAVLFADATLATWPQSRCTRAALEFLGGSNGGRSRVVTEQDLLRRIPLQVQDYLTVESAANIVYAAFSVAVLCTYDAAVLSPDLLLGCQRTHRRILKERSFGDSPHFLEPAAFLAGGSAVVHPPAGASSLSCDLPADLATARALVRSRAMEAGFDGPILDDLVLAAGEVLTNALIVGQAPRIMHVYLEGSAFVCHIQDAGAGLADPLAGFSLPPVTATGGRGLWVARQCCDAVQIATDATGTHVRLINLVPSQAGAG